MILPKLTAIGSGKGGTGKTLAATTLAAVLAQRGERVLLCDADLGLSNTAVHLGLEDGGDLAGLLSDRVTLAEAVVPVMGGAGERGGFDLVAAPSGSGTLANLEPGIVDKLVAKLRRARAYDRILVDLSAGVDAIAMGIAARADETLLLLTADPASLTDAYAFVKLLLRARGRKPWVLVNLAESESEARRTADALAKTCRTFLKTEVESIGSIPRDHHVSVAIRQQRTLTAIFPLSPAAKAFERLARRLCEPAVRGRPFENAFSAR